MELLYTALIIICIASISEAYLRNYSIANTSLPYDQAVLHCKLQFGTSSTLAGFNGYPPEERDLMKLCSSSLNPSESKTCWVNSPSRNKLHNPLCHFLIKQPEITDEKKAPNLGKLLRPVSCSDESHGFVCTHRLSSKPLDPVLKECLSSPPSSIYSPSTRVAHPKESGIILSWLIAATNDEYGSLLNLNSEVPRRDGTDLDLYKTLGYKSAHRSSASLAAVVHGSEAHGLLHSTEVLFFDWGSDALEPLRCTRQFRHVLSTVPKVCKGDGDRRTCASSLVRIVQVDRDTAQLHAPGSPVSEVHTINMAARIARGKMILRIDQDTLTRSPFFGWLAWQQRHGFPDANSVWWHPRDSHLRYPVVMDVPYDIRHYVKHCSRHNYSMLVPPRERYDRVSQLLGDGGSWNPCQNGAVGVYGYPVELMKSALGFNERYYFWGDMESEFCARARNSSAYHTWIDLRPEIGGECGPSFSNMQHGYGERRINVDYVKTSYKNDPMMWGLWNETVSEFLF